MSSNNKVSSFLGSSKGFFPSIPSPRQRRHNKSLILHKQVSQTLSPRSLAKGYPYQSQNITKEEKVVSNFLLKYLNRKQNQEIKWNALNEVGEVQHGNSENKMDPKFRRVYLKKIKGEKKSIVSRFLICNQKFSQLNLKVNQTIQ